MISKPTARGLTLCDYVIVEERTRKISLIGTFNSLRATMFPAFANPFSVWAVLVDREGPAIIKLVVTGLDTDEEIYFQDDPITFPSRLEPFRVHIRLTQFVFPAPGWYEFVLLVDRDSVAQCRVLVHS